MLAPPATVRSAEGGVYRPNCHCHTGTRNSDWGTQNAWAIYPAWGAPKEGKKRTCWRPRHRALSRRRG